MTHVFPTHVGVYRKAYFGCVTFISFPHACGGVPIYHMVLKLVVGFSPRMWGCT